MPRTTKQRAKTPSRSKTRTPAEIELGPLSSFVGYALRRAQVAVFEDFYETLSELGLRPAQFSVLMVIHQNAGSKQSEVARGLGIQTPNFVAIIDALEERGLVERAQDSRDRRSYSLHLTTKGKSLLNDARARQAEHERRMVAKLGERGRDQLLALLAKLATAAEEA
jgi:DNA-binding MarR family transcriptional regulator